MHEMAICYFELSIEVYLTQWCTLKDIFVRNKSPSCTRRYHDTVIAVLYLRLHVLCHSTPTRLVVASINLYVDNSLRHGGGVWHFLSVVYVLCVYDRVRGTVLLYLVRFGSTYNFCGLSKTTLEQFWTYFYSYFMVKREHCTLFLCSVLLWEVYSVLVTIIACWKENGGQ